MVNVCWYEQSNVPSPYNSVSFMVPKKIFYFIKVWFKINCQDKTGTKEIYGRLSIYSFEYWLFEWLIVWLDSRKVDLCLLFYVSPWALSGDKYLSFPDILIRYTFVEMEIGYLRNANFEIVH